MPSTVSITHNTVAKKTLPPSSCTVSESSSAEAAIFISELILSTETLSLKVPRSVQVSNCTHTLIFGSNLQLIHNPPLVNKPLIKKIREIKSKKV